MKLKELAQLLTVVRTDGDMDVEITGFSMHTRTVQPGNLFVCVPGIDGFQEDRHPFAAEALRLGAAGLVVERDTGLDAPTLTVRDARQAMALMACHFYGYPSAALKLIGITGTNGKTTTAHMLEAILEHAGNRTGVMGNIGLKIGGELVETDLINTKEPHKLQASLRQMKERGAEFGVMEVTSLGLDMGRVWGCEFRTAVFTNLTPDHLDFHGTMERYLHAKGRLFSRLGNGFSPDVAKRKFAVLNADDPATTYLSRETAAQIVTYGIEREADVMAKAVRLTPGGAEFELVSFAGNALVKLRMVGLFNVYNALAAIACALLEQIPPALACEALERLNGVPGRMEIVDEGQPFLVLVDYAHTPDGLENALATVRGFAQGRIITVFGCGGDRDRAKRPTMGRLAALHSDRVIVTSDNPRREDPAAIMADVERGLQEAGNGIEYELIADRRQAIRSAVALAAPGDTVLIAGKGHETYQLVQGQTFSMDDREEARKAISILRHDI
ncbi:UDP-N-acetylmuramoyl-L-alanyl-D-glutamate--2,6-diaminopimelate ligase [Paenibacillus hodogayensis]|uniref:UDP-N-acetylmuramoyl-L-alanyl-D-glutamate--2,6-diaminopimelate ligase n=1 Tax=Paenibacillus hodogayensis TaxID=279208 RepID=A0ABV5VVT2_9BACL